MINFRRLFRTLRYLQLRQLGWRAWYLLRRRWECWPPVQYGRRFAAAPFSSQPAAEPIAVPTLDDDGLLPEQRLRELSQHSLTLLGEQRPFHGGADWGMGFSCPDHRLWTITLHYHRWLAALADAYAETKDRCFADLVATYLRDWLATCRIGAAGFQAFAWNSYAIATRLGAWVRIYRALTPGFWQEDPGLQRLFLDSFALQARYLDDHLEWDLRGNHLLRDAVGLVSAGRFLEGPLAQRWWQRGQRLGVEQAREQVLPDGAHFERSPMYHLHAMEDVLALALLAEPAARAEFVEHWRLMTEPALWLRHPDGGIPLFNDAARNGSCSPDALLHAASLLGLQIDLAPRRGTRHFESLGMVVYHDERWSVFFDLGQIGPDYQPGHAHADTLAIECSYRGNRLFVDPGTYHYDNDERRRYDRSTAAHNTVTVDDQDSSEVWHIFRVGRRAYPRDARVMTSTKALTASASHTGYDHLQGGPRHSRSVIVDPSGNLRITDRVAGSGTHRVAGGYLLAPGWQAIAVPGGWSLRHDVEQVQVHVAASRPVELSLQKRAYHPQFGTEHFVPRLAWQIVGPLPVEITIDVKGT
jgi:uncharacterized heparinase superfamily protein